MGNPNAGTAGPSTSKISGTVVFTGQGTKSSPGRRWFSLREKVDSEIRYIELGIIFALPIVVAVFSKAYAFAIVAVEVLSYCFGGLILEFDIWYNERYQEPSYKLGREEGPPPPTTELEITLARLYYFEDKYGYTLGIFYAYLDKEIVPFENLDWIEIVSLLNQLSLLVGKHFEEDDMKGTEKP